MFLEASQKIILSHSVGHRKRYVFHSKPIQMNMVNRDFGRGFAYCTAVPGDTLGTAVQYSYLGDEYYCTCIGARVSRR